MIDTEALVWAYNKLQAFGIGSSNMDSAMMLDRLKDMLFAAPTPPAQEPDLSQEARDWYAKWRSARAPSQERAELPRLVVYKSTLIPKDQWRNMPIDYWLREMLEHCDYHDGLVIKATLTFLEGLQAPAQADEPVAVIDESDDGKFADLTVEGTLLKRGTKLYTRPDNSELRKAAGELLKQLDWACDIKFSGHENSKAYYKAARELRAALEGK